MAQRDDLLKSFLTANGWGNADRVLLAADASFRHYDRLTLNGEKRVLMDAPPPMEDVRPFLKVARHLEKTGFSAPHVFDADEENGFVLLEDFGDETYTRLLKKGADEKGLYRLATDVLIDLNRRDESESVPDGLPPYDEEALMKEAMLFPDWYMPAVFGRPTDPRAADEYARLWKEVFPLVEAVPRTMVLRDYHVDNLMILHGRDGIKACGLLDFQDALNGAVTYDIMSLMEDARRDIDPALLEEMRERYIAGMDDKLDRDAFLTSWAVLAAQRHAKVLGIFVRLCVRDHKPRYLVHIPRLWKLIERALRHPALANLKDWFDRNVPEEYRIVPECQP